MKKGSRSSNSLHNSITVPLLGEVQISGKTCVYSAKRSVLYHDKRHTLEIGEKEISEFLTYLAVQEHVAASTQNQARKS